MNAPRNLTRVQQDALHNPGTFCGATRRMMRGHAEMCTRAPHVDDEHVDGIMLHIRLHGRVEGGNWVPEVTAFTSPWSKPFRPACTCASDPTTCAVVIPAGSCGAGMTHGQSARVSA